MVKKRCKRFGGEKKGGERGLTVTKPSWRRRRRAFCNDPFSKAPSAFSLKCAPVNAEIPDVVCEVLLDHYLCSLYLGDSCALTWWGTQCITRKKGSVWLSSAVISDFGSRAAAEIRIWGNVLFKKLLKNSPNLVNILVKVHTVPCTLLKQNQP